MELCFSHLHKCYGKVHALKDVSFTLTEGVHGLLGPNGSGKTTLLNVCAGIFKADRGCALLDGKDAFDNDVERTKLFYLSDNFYFPVGASIKTAAKFYKNYFFSFLLIFK